jgi:glycosyltransferase involved in cell wall biosynthesis
LENKLLSASNIYNGKTFTIHNFIERKFTPNKLENNNPYIVFVGRLSAEKGVKLLSETAKLLPKINFVVAGTGPDDDCLKDIPNINLLGFVSGQDLADLMANAKLLIAPSVCYENCPLSILEAHSMGVPVVTMNSGGMAELVCDGKTGGLCFEPTPTCLAETLEKCLEDNQYQILKTNCEEISSKIMGVKEYSQILIQKYTELKG